MILCHKCAGILACGDDEDTSGLSGCGCISGYVRGFEPQLGRADVILAQIKAEEGRKRLYTTQGRDAWEIQDCDDKIERLKGLIGKENV